MELRCCGHLHFIQAIKGGLVTKVPNVARGQPKLKFKKPTDIYDGLLSHNDDGMVERSLCCGETEESTVKTKPVASVCYVNDDDDDDQRINNLDDDDFGNFTLSQIKASCKTRKRKHSQSLDSSKINIKIEDSSFLEDYREEQMAADDSDFLETLSSWKSKLSKNMKAKKKKCFKEPISTYTQEIMLVVKSEAEEILNSPEFPPSCEEIQNSQEFPPSSEQILDCQDFSPSSEQVQDFQELSTSFKDIQDGLEFPPSSEEIKNDQGIPFLSGDSVALVEVKSEVHETDCYGRPDDYSIVESQEAEVVYEWNLDNELNEWREHVDFIPLQIVRPSSMDIVIRNTQLGNNQCPNMPAIEFENEECIFHPYLHHISPQEISLFEDHNSDTHDTQPDGEIHTAVSLPNVATHKDLDCIGVELKDGNTILGDSSNDEFTTGAEDKVKRSSTIEYDCSNDKYTAGADDQLEPSSTIEHDCSNDELITGADDQLEPSSTIEHDCNNDELITGAEDQVEPSSTIERGPKPDGCLVSRPDDPPEYEEEQSFASINIDEKGHVNVATDELTSWGKCNGSSKLHRPKRLSTRKAISTSSPESLWKAMESIDLNRKNYWKCKGKLYFCEQADKMNGTAKGLDDITGAPFTDIRNKISVIPRTKRVSHPKGISKIPRSSRQASRLGCSSAQSCSKSAISFTQQQMQDAECLAMKLTKELKSMKDIVDDMLRSEFCLNTSLRHKVNEATKAVKNATRAEEAAKRCLTIMSRDCNRFCKIMKLADDGPPSQEPPQDDVVHKERKTVAFADEAGGRLCEVKFYEEDSLSLSEFN